MARSQKNKTRTRPFDVAQGRCPRYISYFLILVLG